MPLLPKGAARSVFTFTLLLGALSGAVQVHAQVRNDLVGKYRPYEYMIPMRDGVKLYTIVWVPKGVPGKKPILMQRTPYGAGSPSAGAPRASNRVLVNAGFIFAYQDVRGKGKSEGDFVNVRPQLKRGKKGIDESTDTYDTVDFLVKNVYGNNGKVGLWGISYPGFYAGIGAVNNHPALKAVSPQAPVSDWFLGDDVHHNGAFFLQETFDFMLGFDVPRGKSRVVVDRENLKAYDFFLKAGGLANYEPRFLKGGIPYWEELINNGVYNDYWKDRSLPRSLKNTSCAILTVGGFFDKEDMWGALNTYQAAERQNPGIPNFLAMGPWSHGQWSSGAAGSLGPVPFGELTGKTYQEKIEGPFFLRYLADRTDVPMLPEATIFETGVNKWHEFKVWPPRNTKPLQLFLDKDNKVVMKKPSEQSQTSYVNDPAKPTPYLADFEKSTRAPGDWLILDQRYFSTRKDVVTYSTPPLTEDQQIAGTVEADIWIKTTGTDADLVVKLIDAWPEDSTELQANGKDTLAGYQMMVRGDIFRAKFRHHFEKTEAITPGKPTRVKFKLNDAMHTFRKGHRIIVQIQSSWFPIADRNPNKFMDIYRARDEDFQKATIDILQGGRFPSSITVSQLKK